ALRRIFVKQRSSRATASTADARHRSWMSSSEQQIKKNDQQFSVRNHHAKARDGGEMSSQLFRRCASRTRSRGSKKCCQASSTRSSRYAIPGIKDHRGIQTGV